MRGSLMIGRADLANRQQGYFRDMRRFNWISNASFMVLLGLLLPIGAYLDRQEQFTRVFNILLASGFMVFMLLLGFGCTLVPRRFVRKWGLSCPNCSREFTGVSGQIVMATGRCGRCGCRVVSDS